FLLERCRPVYETLQGWGKDVTGARKVGDLPANARRYVDRLGELLGVRVSVISVGPDRAQTILCDNGEVGDADKQYPEPKNRELSDREKEQIRARLESGE